MSNGAESFRTLVRDWLPCFDRIAIGAVGFFDGAERRVMSAQLVLAPSQMMPKDRPELCDRLFWGALETRPFSPNQVDALLDDFGNGIVRFSKWSARLPLENGQRPHATFFPGHHPSQPPNQSAPRLATLIQTGISRQVALQSVIALSEIDWHLRACAVPFFDLNDLLSEYGLPTPPPLGDTTVIEFVVRAPVEIDIKSSIVEGQARVQIRASSNANRNAVSIGYRDVGPESNRRRGRLPAGSIAWRQADEWLEGSATVDVGKVPALQCFVSYEGVAAHSWWVVDPTKLLNPRQAVHLAFDSEQKRLKSLLFDSKRSDAREFEDGVALLLAMLGFSVTQHGRSQKLSDAPDVLAVTPSGNVVVVECTVGTPTEGDQIAKILRRSEAIRKSVTAAGWPSIQVLPLVVTNLSEAEMPGEREEATGRGVVVAGREDIEAALQEAQFAVDAERWFKTALDQINSASQILGR
jgi:hypothetical protein